MDVAVVVNLRARRGTEAIGRMVRAALPTARISVTRSLDDVRRWIERDLAPNPPEVLLSGGGDGTATALINEMRDRNVEVGRLGVLRLGTGNGWANVTGAPRAEAAIRHIAGLSAVPPTRRFALVECDGRIAPFLGTGWDAEIISDFREQLARATGGDTTTTTKTINGGLYGYLKGVVTKTIPRHVFGGGQANVVLTNLGDHAQTIDEHGRIVKVPGGEPGAVLYRGPASVAAAATTQEWGFGFRAFPHAHAAPDRVSVRVYGAPVLEATRNMLKLWRGDRVPKMHDFFLTRGRMDFDRPVPFQIGGDLQAPRTSFEFHLAGVGVDLIDWAKLAA